MSQSSAVQHASLEMGNLLMVQERERLVLRVLLQHGYSVLEGVRAFEAGCSAGHNLLQLLQWGARPEDLAAIDVDPAFVAYCKTRTPGIRVHEGSAEVIPETGASFDISLAFTLFSSVREERVSAAIASELVRITGPGGLILVYDMRRRGPRNPDVHPVSTEDIRRWFPRCPLRTYTTTLAPPLARRVGRFARFLYAPLAALPPLRSHALHVLRRPADPRGANARRPAAGLDAALAASQGWAHCIRRCLCARSPLHDDLPGERGPRCRQPGGAECCFHGQEAAWRRRPR